MATQDTENTVKAEDLPAIAAILREIANGLGEAQADMAQRKVDQIEATNWKTAKKGLKYMKSFCEDLPGLIRYAKIATDLDKYAVDNTTKKPVVRTKPAEAVAKSKKKATQ